MRNVLATAYWRKERNFVAGMERSIPGSEFLVARSDNGGAILGKRRNALGIESKELLDGGGVRKLKGFFGLPDDVFQTAKEQNLHSDGL